MTRLSSQHLFLGVFAAAALAASVPFVGGFSSSDSSTAAEKRQHRLRFLQQVATDPDAPPEGITLPNGTYIPPQYVDGQWVCPIHEDKPPPLTFTKRPVPIYGPGALTFSPTNAPSTPPPVDVTPLHVCIDESNMYPTLEETNALPTDTALPVGSPDVLKVTARNPDGTTVDFVPAQAFGPTVTWFAVEYDDGSAVTCSDMNNPSEGPVPSKYVAYCSPDTMSATVTIYASSDAFASMPPYTGESTCYYPPDSSILVQKYEILCGDYCEGTPLIGETAPPTPAPEMPCLNQDEMEPVLVETNQEPPLPIVGDVIHVTERTVDGSSIQFVVNQIVDDDTVTYVGIQYDDEPTSTLTCSPHTDVPQGPIQQVFTASCDSRWIATVTVFLSDDADFQGVVGPESTVCTIPMTSNTVSLTYEIPCASDCIPPCVDEDKMLPVVEEQNVPPESLPPPVDEECELIEIMDRTDDASTVGFQVHQCGPTPVPKIAVEYETPESPEGPQCVMYENVPTGPVLPNDVFTAVCAKHSWMATVTVYVYDDANYGAVPPYDTTTGACGEQIPSTGSVVVTKLSLPCNTVCIPPPCTEEEKMLPIPVTSNVPDQPEIPVIEITSRSITGTAVEFIPSQSYSPEPVSFVGIEYEDEVYGKTCLAFQDVPQGPLPTPIKAVCSDATWMATVTVYTSDASLDGVPAPTAGTCTIPATGGTIASTYDLPCAELCVTPLTLTDAPTAAPTTPLGPPPCLKEDEMEPVLVSNNSPDTPPTCGVISVTENSVDGQSVEFVISQCLGTEVPYVGVEYTDETTGGPVCTPHAEVPQGPMETVYRAKCNRQWMAEVTVYAYDTEAFTGTVDESIVTSCTLPSTENVVALSYEIPCAKACIPPCVDEDSMYPVLVDENAPEVPTTGDVIEITTRTEDASTVDFTVSQVYNDDVPAVGVEYETPTGPVCSMFENVPSGPLLDSFQAVCDSQWMATVTVYAYDDTDFANVPGYAPPEPTTCQMPTTGGVVAKTYRLPCPVACIPPPCVDSEVMEPSLESSNIPTTPEEPVIEIVTRSSSGLTVEFVPSQVYSDTPVEYVGIEYDDVTYGKTCSGVTGVAKGPLPSPYKATCSPSTWTTTVTVYTYDTTFAGAATLPAGMSAGCSLPAEDGVIVSTYTLPCADVCEVPPTMAPTDGPTECIPKTEVEMVGDFGDYTPREEMFKIIQQHGDAVTVHLSQAWKLTELDWIGAEFDSVTGETVCYHEENAISGPLKETFTAKCVEGVAEFKVFVRDDCFIPLMGFNPDASLLATPTLAPISATVGGNSLGGDTLLAGDDIVRTRAPVQVIQTPTMTCPKAEHVSTDPKTTTKFNKMPIEIVTFGEDKVTFKVHQTWKASAISWIATRFPNGAASDECPKVDEVEPGEPLIYTATCNDAKEASVWVYVHDGSFSKTADNAAVPAHCQPSRDQGRKAGYEFKLPCSCPSSTRRLTLAAGTCEVQGMQGGTLTATFIAPCDPGCGVEPLALPMPTDKPTASPTAPPTEPPKVTEPPTPAPTECVPKLTPVRDGDYGEYTPNEDVIEILRQNGDTVTFQLIQSWKLLELDWIGAEYESVSGTVCYSEEAAVFGPVKETFTAKCVNGVADVDVYVRDICFLPIISVGPSELSEAVSSQLDLPTIIEEPSGASCPGPELTRRVGASADREPDNPPIQIMTYGNDKVSFKVKQTWKESDSISWIATHYYTGPTTVECPKEEEVTSERALMYQAFCQEDGYADVTLFVHDGSFSKTADNANVPSYCKPSNDQGKKIALKYRLPCKCPEQRRLATSAGGCDLQGGTLKATYHIPCDPGCGVEPLSLPIPIPPTAAPTAPPTAAPTAAPTPKETECIPKFDAELTSDMGSFNPTEEMIDILQQSADGKTVTVQLNQVWKLTELDWTGAEYTGANGLVCYGEEYALYGPLKTTFTALCENGRAQFKVFARDDCFLPPITGFAPVEEGNGEMDLLPEVVDDVGAEDLCPAATLVGTDGKKTYSDLPIDIVNYGNDKVTFKVHQKWKSNGSISWIATRFPAGAASVECPKEESVNNDRALVYTAYCMDGFADVDVYVHDGSFSKTEDNASVPSYCNPSNDQGRKVGYKFKVPCSCQATRRHLLETTGSCELLPGTLQATYDVPCTPGCGAEPINIPIPTQPPEVEAADRSGLAGEYVEVLEEEEVKEVTAAPTTLAPTPAPPPVECPVVEMDFNNIGLEKGQYITDELKNSHGFTVKAKGGSGAWTPGGAARIFDTSDPGTNNDNGDPDLGSPNAKCPGGGPGVGKGGEPNSQFANCKPQGFVLIVQEKNSRWKRDRYPDDAAKGGELEFKFTKPVKINTVYILDIDEHKPVEFELKTSEGKNVEMETPKEWHGDNGLFPFEINVNYVEELTVNFPGSGAVAQIDYQPEECP